MGILYLGYPAPNYNGDPASLVTVLVNTPASLKGSWLLRVRKYAADCSLNAQDFCSTVLQEPGPVLLLEPIQSISRQEVVRRLGGRVPVAAVLVTCIGELEAAVTQAIKDFEAGEPRIALDVAVALLLMQKLNRNNMWAGNAKGYMWAADIPKGRGLDQKYAPRLSVVMNALLQGGMLTFKVSQGRRKYALNPEMRANIHEILRTRKFPELTETSLLRNKDMESVLVLDAHPVDEPPSR